MRVVIVGAGMAGTRLAGELAARDPGGRMSVTVLGGEGVPGYNRVLLCDMLAGRLSTSDLLLPAPATAVVRLRAEVVTIEPMARRARTADGKTYEYDVLVLATGSAPVSPPLASRIFPENAGVHVLCTVADYAGLLAALPSASRAVVVGGGPLGVESAVVLADRGLAVTVVHRHARLLPASLDADGAAMLRRLLRARGVVTHVALAATAIHTNRRGAVTAVGLDGGRTIDADVVVLACGARPRVELARAAGLPLAHRSDGRVRGVAVDETLRTADPYIYAIGDCAAHPDPCAGHATPAWDQAMTLADRLSGHDPRATYRGTPRIVRLRAGLDLVAAGDPESAMGDRVVQFADATRCAYQRLVIRGGLVVGLVAIGPDDSIPEIVDWYVRAIPVPSAQFLRPSIMEESA